MASGRDVSKDASSELESKNNNTVDEYLEEEPPMLSHNQKCEQHADEPVLAYNKLTYEYLCARCVSSQKLAKEHYQVYPSVVTRTVERIESAKKMIKFKRTQLEQTAIYIRKKVKQNKELLLKRVSQHTEELQRSFESYKRRHAEMVNDAIKSQDVRIEDVLAGIDEHLEQLDSNEFNVASLEENDGSVIAFMHNIVDELYKNVSKFKPDINLEGLKIDIETDPDVVHRLDKLLNRSAELMHSSLPPLDGSDRCPETYRDLIKNMWNCYICGSLYGIKQVDCPVCKVFRPLETYENILHRPEKVTEYEIEALKSRRKIEKQIILDLELNGESSPNKTAESLKGKQNKRADPWYMISSDWLFKWKCFVTNKISKAVNTNILQEIN